MPIPNINVNEAYQMSDYRVIQYILAWAENIVGFIAF